ncbi:MAG TPA: glycosyltransferase family 4 protein [bacterium]|nr:glycosyltransferase family 4 protein [bacterium]HPT29561.1 glycosyltransferase family 4 protein [bacterium]
MKIALIGQKGIPLNQGGGVEKHVENLAVRLVELGHEVLVYTRHNYTDKRIKEYKGVKVINLPSIPTKNLDAISHTFLACLDVIFRKVDVVHFHSIGPSSLLWLVKLFKPRTPVVATFHSQCYFNEKWGRFAKWYLRLGEYMACRKADRLIVVSQTLKDYVLKKYPQARVDYVPNGVNLPEILAAQEITAKWNLRQGEYILNLGRLVKNKGIEYLINAFKQIDTDKKLVITGDGLLTDELKALAQGDDRIIFTGSQSGKVFGELLSNAALFVQPSESEGLSLSLLEAMSYGLPCLVSNIPANVEVVEDSQLIFKTKDENDLKTKLELALNNPELLQQNKEQMLSLVKKKYYWPDLVDQIVLIYGKLANQA